MKFFQYLLKIDRRIIYVVMGLLVTLPLVKPLGLGVTSGPRAARLFAAVDSIPPGKTLLISVDFDPASMPELYPMLTALMRHAFAKDLKVLLCGLWVTGAGLANRAATEIPPEYGKKYVRTSSTLATNPAWTLSFSAWVRISRTSTLTTTPAGRSTHCR